MIPADSSVSENSASCTGKFNSYRQLLTYMTLVTFMFFTHQIGDDWGDDAPESREHSAHSHGNVTNHRREKLGGKNVNDGE